MDNFSMIRIRNMILKSYEIVYIFVTPSPPLTRRYLITENVDNCGRPLRTALALQVSISICVCISVYQIASMPIETALIGIDINRY